MPAPSSGEITVEEARARMLEGVGPAGLETITLAAAIGRTLAAPVIAVCDQPPFDASSMDGWAIRMDADPTADFRVVGESAAGRPFDGAVRSGETVRAFTGAAVPSACRVIVQERATRTGDMVRFEAHEADGDNVRPRGGDFRAGQVLLPAGVRIDPWRLSLAAAAGRATVDVAVRPRVAVLSTGEEIVRPGQDAGPGQIFDANGPALAALIETWGGLAAHLAPAGDNGIAIAGAVRDIACDLIVTVGGASVGDHDLVKPAMRRLGLVQTVDSIRLRPGKPTWFGALADGRRVLGLPGNPASALVCAELFLKPLLLAWQGADPALRLEAARLAEPLPAVGPREHWMRARLGAASVGATPATPFQDQDSSLISVLAQADALLRRPAGAVAAVAGAAVDILRLTRL